MISSKFLLFRALLSLIFVINLEIFQLSKAAPVVTSNGQATAYLQNFGYIEETSPNAVISETSFVSAIRDFQRFAGLPDTGRLDNATLTMMNKPRCGVRDKVGHNDVARQKRYALHGTKWDVADLTYKIRNYPRTQTNQQAVDEQIAKALKMWSDVTNINFQRVQGNENIEVMFGAGQHGPNCGPFDGPGGTLAHAFLPQGGDAHFDDDEEWTINQYHGQNLLQVAVHEFGHSLGLSHSDVQSSIMVPWAKGYDPSFRLDDDDIQGIQALYGKRNNANLCQDSAIDAFTRTHDGRGYVFKGDYYWEITDSGIANGYSRRITEDWGGLPGNLDAAFTWEDGQTFFFKGNQYWKFRNKNMDFGYPRLISDGFEGIPDNVDAAFVWSGNGEKYFFKGEYYWKFDSKNKPHVASFYPQLISSWKGLPSNIDAAVQWSNQNTYFFKGQEYYKYDDAKEAVEIHEIPFPRRTSVWWFGC